MSKLLYSAGTASRSKQIIDKIALVLSIERPIAEAVCYELKDFIRDQKLDYLWARCIEINHCEEKIIFHFAIDKNDRISSHIKAFTFQYLDYIP